MLLINEQRLTSLPQEIIDNFIETKNNLLNVENISITNNTSSIKAIVGANNYVSFAVYWHPNPDTPTGYPYIRKDGVRNKDVSTESDSLKIYLLIKNLYSLTLLYYFTKSEVYAQKAIEMLRVFFINEETRMNPDLTYSGIVIGDNESDLRIRGAIIDTNRLSMIVDLIEMLKSSSHWTPSDDISMKAWFSDVSDWFQNSPRGILQSGYLHNIRTSHALQLAAYLCGAGRSAEAVTYLNNNVPNILYNQINEEGLQVLEMDRVANRHYSNFNLFLLCELAKISQSLNIDIWNYVDEGGRGSIKNAMKYMCGFANDTVAWPFSEEKYNSAMTRKFLESGAMVYDDYLIINTYKPIKMIDTYAFLEEYLTIPSNIN